MYKYFFIILLGLTSFLSPAQDVVISADAARYFLEQDDRAKLLTVKDSIDQQIIENLDWELQIKNSIIKSYKNDSIIYKSIIANKDQQISVVKEEVIVAQKIIAKQKFMVCVFAGAAGGSVIGSVAPVIGTLSGGLVGGVVGCVIHLFKHKKP